MNEINGGSFRVSWKEDGVYQETLYLLDEEEIPVLRSCPYASVFSDSRMYYPYLQEGTKLVSAAVTNQAAEIRLEHPDYTVTRRISFPESGEGVNFQVCCTAKKELFCRSLEDKWSFLVPRKKDEGPLNGPLDFVWSQRIKSFPSTFVSHYNFRSPIVMMQQDELFAGLVPALEKVTAQFLEETPLGMDLDVTREAYPWMSYGMIVGDRLSPDLPCMPGHSQIVRTVSGEQGCRRLLAGESISYSYTLLLSRQEPRQGYRSAVRYLWKRYGENGVNLAENLNDNPRYPENRTLEAWRKSIWAEKAEEDYFSLEKEGVTVGGLTGRRQGEWFSRTDTKKDVWFGCWLQELVTGYGLALYGRRSGQEIWKKRAQEMLNYILKAPRTKGMFPVICYVEKDGSENWQNDDGWAGYQREFHTMPMSWTAWLMLRWGKELCPERQKEILDFCRPYADFLQKAQNPNGCIPSWFSPDGIPSRAQFRDFNAETASSALFLLEYGDMVQDAAALACGRRALSFVTDQVLPRNRWYDFETFLSCSKKSFGFYDSITAQYPQCNLSAIHAAAAYLVHYRITQRPEDLEQAEAVLDYLLLTQQLWNHPLMHIKAFGGFTVQNTDHEWSDVREEICAVILYHYYLATGRTEYLERSIAAARSGFEVLPFENWAHCGYEGLQYDSSLLWGGGVVMAAAEYLNDRLGTLAIDADAIKGFGVDNCVVTGVTLSGGVLSVTADLSRHPQGSPLTMSLFDVGKRVRRVILNGEEIAAGPWQTFPEKLSFQN